MVFRGNNLAFYHWDVEYHDSKGKWMVTRHGDNGMRNVEAHRATKKKAINRAKGLATYHLYNIEPEADKAEIHIYKKGGEKPQRIEKVST